MRSLGTMHNEILMMLKPNQKQNVLEGCAVMLCTSH